MAPETPPPDDRLRTLWREGRAAWPGLALSEQAFVAWAREAVADATRPSGAGLPSADARRPSGAGLPEADARRPSGAGLPTADAPGQGPDAGDVYLVAACMLGVPGATRAFIDGPLAAVEPSLVRLLSDPEARAELLQDLAVHLLVAEPGAAPRLAQYDGRAPLRAWLRVTAARRALNMHRGKSKAVPFEAIVYEQASEHDPELSMLRRVYRDEIAAIFADAVAAIGDTDRALLRLYYVQRTTIAELAVIQRTSRSSLQRQLAAIRDTLSERIQKLVRERLKLSDSQRGSMLRIFDSDMRRALAHLLRDR